MYSTVTICLKPDALQYQKMLRVQGCVRVCYNKALEYWNKVYDAEQRSPIKEKGYDELREYIQSLKQSTDYLWMSELPYHTMNIVIANLRDAFKRYFSPKLSAKHPTAHRKNPSHLSIPIRTDKVVFRGKYLSVPSFGRMRYKYVSSTPILKICKATIIYDGSQWLLKIVTPVEVKDKSKSLKGRIGIDLGYRTLATLYNGEIVLTVPNVIKEGGSHKENMAISKHISKCVERVKKLDALIAMKLSSNGNTNSNNVNKLRLKRRLLLRRIANTQDTYLHKMSKQIANLLSSEIVMETLDISETKEGHSVVPGKYKVTALYKFFTYIKYKAELNGTKVILADKYYPSTKQCHRCKTINIIGASKIYRCKYCGLVMDRDINASINLYNYK